MAGYPKTKYHKSGHGGSIEVTSAQQEKALGADWLDYAVEKAEKAGDPPVPKRAGKKKAEDMA